MPVKAHLCPYYGAETTKIHDYRTQIITDIPVYFKNTKLIYNKRRYECKLCHKSFYENNSIVNKYSRKSTRLTEFVVDQLRKLSSCSDIANMCGISPGYISRLFPYLAVTPSHLPKVLCIDEFKGNTGHYKYQVALKSCGGTKGETYKTIIDTKIDEVFVVTDTMEMFIIPIEEIKNKTTLNLCEKYEKNRVKI